MLTLALETGGTLGSVALGEDDEVLFETALRVRAGHSEVLMPEVERILERSGRRPEDVTAVAVGAGPGSFTGVRIAASLAKGFCAATGADLYAFSRLAVVAAGTGLAKNLCVLLEARPESVFAAAYATLEPLQPVLGPERASVDDVLARIAERAGRRARPARTAGWSFAGGGALRHREWIEERGGRVLSFLHAVPRAGALLWLVRSEPERGRVPEPADWEPEYLRSAGARRVARD